MFYVPEPVFSFFFIKNQSCLLYQLTFEFVPDYLTFLIHNSEKEKEDKLK